MLSPLFQYFADVSQEAIRCEPPHRGRVEMTHYGRYTLVMHEINGLIERRWFQDEAPIFNYHLPQEVRRQLVGEMYKSGCKGSEVAELLGVKDSTVSTDLKFLRAYYPDQASPQIKATDVTPEDCILNCTSAMKPEVYRPSQQNWLLG